jgi:hypothetical protein
MIWPGVVSSGVVEEDCEACPTNANTGVRRSAASATAEKVKGVFIV